MRYIDYLKRNINIMIYIASPKEYDTTIKFLNDKQDCNYNIFSIDDMTYCLAKIKAYKAILVKGGNIGDNSPNGVSPIIGKALSVFSNINYLITIGVCASLSKELNVGDVVVANQIIDYESTREGPNGPIDRSSPLSVNQLSNNLATHISSMQFADFKVKFGKVLSGSKLIDNKKIAQKILNLHKEALALDMEGYAIAK